MSTPAALLAAVLAAGGLVAFVAALVLGGSVTVVGASLAVALFSGAFLAAHGLPAPSERPARSLLRPSVPRGRRTLLGRLVAGAAVLAAAVGIPALVVALRPQHVVQQTAWRQGVRLVTTEGRPIRADEVPVGGMATAWPEGGRRVDSEAVVLVRLSGRLPEPPTVLEWVVGERLIAYSKVCTHAGCPVGLFIESDGSLFCPCHQATFDGTRGAVPVFGPASRPLAQLPLGVDDLGFLIALGDFVEPVGPVAG